jgi:phosphoribosylformimino-5-aminoimidazole carboxamide ribotide isomerase
VTLFLSNNKQVIITSFLFPDGKFSKENLLNVLAALGNDKDKLVIDLSCRRKDNQWFVAMNKWQTITNMKVDERMIYFSLELLQLTNC